jgi:hypothetical protein
MIKLLLQPQRGSPAIIDVFTNNHRPYHKWLLITGNPILLTSFVVDDNNNEEKFKSFSQFFTNLTAVEKPEGL